jgi:hypothetical protein
MDPHDIARRLVSEGVATLPDVGPLPLAAVHAVYAAVLAHGPWLPLITLDARHARTAADVHAADLAGLVYAGRGVPRGNLAAAVRSRGGLLLVQGDEHAPAFGTLLHPAATDPTTRRQRGVLAAWLAGGEPALLLGGIGVGRSSLAVAACPGVEVVRDLDELAPHALAPILPRLEVSPPNRGGPRGARPNHPAIRGLLGEDARFCHLLEDALRVAPSAVPVLVLGETGVGKEPLARLLHNASGRRGQFVAVDLTSRNANLVDDDLFGHVPGAFEGARTPREGAIRRAHRGTLFLDELGDLPPSVQQKLLRVLEGGEVQPLGSDALHPVDVRVVAATNADLEAMVRAGTFRSDLYHRLAGAILRPPPLRERGEDVLLLASAFAAELGTSLAPDAGPALLARSFPGNVRELRRLVEGAAARTRGPLGAADLREERRPWAVTASGELRNLPRRLALRLEALQITVGAPAERGPECLRNAMAFGLAGRPVTAAAVRALLEAPWWGNFLEIERKLAAIQAQPAGPVDVADIGRLFPIAVHAREPIVAVVHPALREDGGVSGFVQSFSTGALIVGRARSRGDLGPRAAWASAIVGDASLSFLAFPHLADLSRCQLVVHRVEGGLAVEVPPDTTLSVEVERLDGGRGRRIGTGASIRVLRGTDPVLELWIFLGEDWAKPLAARLAREADVVNDTMRGGPRRAWSVGGDEREFLRDVLLRFVRGDREFAPTLRDALAERPDLAELRAYLGSANPSQSFARLVQNPANELLRTTIRAALRDDGLLDRARLRLPTLVRTALVVPADEPG